MVCQLCMQLFIYHHLRLPISYTGLPPANLARRPTLQSQKCMKRVYDCSHIVLGSRVPIYACVCAFCFQAKVPNHNLGSSVKV